MCTFLKFVRLCCIVASMVVQNISLRYIYLHALFPPRHKHGALCATACRMKPGLAITFRLLYLLDKKTVIRKPLVTETIRI